MYFGIPYGSCTSCGRCGQCGGGYGISPWQQWQTWPATTTTTNIEWQKQLDALLKTVKSEQGTK